ncbi:MAG TPA: M23 family metallopeptidase [Clostridia bacterium]|nr:M23 family metallopeptidase [Clostridia bacterium]
METKNYDNLNSDEIQRVREARRSRSETYISRNSEKKEKNDYLSRLILIQSIICAVIVLLTFSIKKFNPEAFSQLKVQYNSIMSEDMSARDVWAAMKNVSGFIILPSDKWQTGEPTTNDENTSETLADGGATVTTTEDGATKAQEGTTGEPTSNKNEAETLKGAGGEDLSLLCAEKKASFAPFYITAKAVTPVSGRITSNFGYRIHPITKEMSFHTGIDIAAPQGERIACAYYGKVQEIGFSETGGNYVLMEHQNGLQTLYFHCDEVYVEVGAFIRAGETIALVGSTGITTGPHLHFEVRIDKTRYNPMYILDINDNKT